MNDKEKSLAYRFPELAKEWHPTKNEGLTPFDVSYGSDKKVWWLCKNNHSYHASISNRTMLNRGCPYCSGKKVIIGVNDFETLNPDIAKEWDYEKNEILPNSISSHSNKKVWWKCKTCGNSWLQDCNHRVSRRSGCPYCSGRIANKGINDLATVNPELVEEWDTERNIGITPHDVLPKSNKKVWWKCKQGHEWKAAICERTSGTNCPVCVGKQVVEGFNDLQTTHPNLAAEWDYEKNKGTTPQHISHGSTKNVWWKCNEGHTWKSSVANRTRGNNCPICGNQQLLKGYNDLATVNPELAQEWNYAKNVNLHPSDIFPNYNKKVWWICRKGHEWQATPNSRIQGTGCPICSSELHTSFPEQCIFFYITQKTHATNREKVHGKEIDIFVPQYNLAVEYNGSFFHKDQKNKDKQKYEFLRNQGIRLIVVEESDKNTVGDDVIYYKYNSRDFSNLEWAISQLLKFLHFDDTNVNISKDEIKIKEQYIQWEKANSVLNKFPELSKEWHPTKNGRITPEMVSYQSNMKVWWLGKCGHEWYADVAHRVSGRGCPYCSNKKVLVGYNDLSTTNPNLAKEWNYKRNLGLSPQEITQGSNKKVWWVCQNGHEWEAVISSRNRGNGCPYCSGRKLLSGMNDLATVYPLIAEEWNHEKNGDLLPCQITSRNNKKVWWKCRECGYEWETRIVHRANGHGCPVCSKRKRAK